MCECVHIDKKIKVGVREIYNSKKDEVSHMESKFNNYSAMRPVNKLIYEEKNSSKGFHLKLLDYTWLKINK